MFSCFYPSLLEKSTHVPLSYKLCQHPVIFKELFTFSLCTLDASNMVLIYGFWVKF
jgi:hypothetical protein